MFGFGKKSKNSDTPEGSEQQADGARRRQEEKAARKARRRAKYGPGSDAETTAVGISGIIHG
ncbi:hypothetical protein [Kitasatospora terrestris]|uniref:DUF3043 domain-containing protein n=1 Tax=Kitasatospora terrestris TaxID=258051 RepID=A0ABP9EH07_9ACTN